MIRTVFYIYPVFFKPNISYRLVCMSETKHIESTSLLGDISLTTYTVIEQMPFQIR